MSFAPPSPSDQGSNPFPPFNPTPPPGQQPPVMPTWATSQTFPASSMPSSFRPPRGRSAFRAALFVVPALIAAGVTTFIYLDAKQEAKDARDDVLASVEESLDAIPDITVPVITVPDVTVPAVAATVAPAGEAVVSAAPATIAAGAVASGDAATIPAAVSNLWSVEGSAAVLAAYESAISGDPTRFVDLRIYVDYAFANAQDAAIPEHVDEYEYRKGSVGSPAPVQLIGDGDLEASLWSLADIDVTQIPRIVTEAPMVSNIEEPEVVYVGIERSVFIPGNPVTIKVYINGPRSSGFVEYDAAGNVIDIVV